MVLPTCIGVVAITSSDLHFCPHCQQPITVDAHTCPSCGRAVATEDETRVRGERKPVTALFADVVGSTALAEQTDAEEWGTLVNRAFTVMSQSVERYGGTVAQFLGDGILALFGAPIAHEDDPERAVRAALEMREAIGRVTNLQIRVGINTGEVVVGDIASELRYGFTALGDALNVAARMQTAADPGDILITASTYQRLALLVEVDDLGAVTAKGKSGPVHAYRVLRLPTTPRPRHAERCGPVLSRGEELAQLRAAVALVRAGRGRVALVTGEPGIPYYLLLEVVRNLLGLPASVAGETARDLLSKVLTGSEVVGEVGGERAAELAGHFERAGQPDGAIDYLIAAGAHALRRLANREALSFYERAAAALRDPLAPEDVDRRLTVLLGLGRAQQRAGSSEEVRDTFTRAAELARAHERAERLAEATLGRAEAWVVWDSEGQLIGPLEEALERLPEGPSSLRARVLARLAQALYAQGSEQRRQRLMRDAEEVARHSGDAAALAEVLLAKRPLLGPDDLEERLRVGEELIAIGERTGDLRRAADGHGWRLVDVLESGDIEEADLELERFARHAGSTPHRSGGRGPQRRGDLPRPTLDIAPGAGQPGGAAGALAGAASLDKGAPRVDRRDRAPAGSQRQAGGGPGVVRAHGPARLRKPAARRAMD
ncbi:MAG: hypothetical protein M3252_05150 [Actinomycetota bacterium]|nr:hypothetical protein [Actinomycetota bacterium]